MSEVLTTRQVAHLCGVSFRTVIRWIERGLLQSYRLPGRGDYRVPLGELQRFMLENGIPNAAGSGGEVGEALGARKVLITEDDPGMASAISRVLDRAGYETVVASDGFAAGAMLYRFQPAVMTLDLRMPGLDGLGVLRYLQRANLPFSLKVLVISADSEARQREALELGAHAVLAKPFENEALVAGVAALFAQA
ncbi:response regulator [Pseudomonas sp. CAU 1711]|uniref:response regulator n=1 Tax=Pseudomonas sp. CAU 1711 TaxID=3140356 RepID=UPI0032618AC1